MPKTKATMHGALGHQPKLGESQLLQQGQPFSKTKTDALNRR